ncbi:hypothetical protein O181_124115 [Austropuccinia psidii MF-1]|uniref:Ty3 transposon capsid-like protein domain-containing protein n=1 Tax=Austropuccinia psidii MF-1 TaxID=1389203 RepID=A0A9Q3KME6_9BASI|nr:hypothetical protein [Austropuccinia psidii MF-1]
MPVQHSPPARRTISQRHQAVLTPTARALLDHTPTVHQLSENLDRGPPMEGAAPSKRGGPRSRLGEAEDEEGEESVEEELSEETEVAAALAGAPEASEASNLALSNQPLVPQAEQNFLKLMEQMTQFMGQLTQAVTPRDTSKAPAFKTPSMKAPDSFDGTKAYKLRGFIQTCQLIFHNDPANFFSYRKKVLHSTSFLTGRAGKWIEPYLSNISNEDPSYLLNNWKLFETQLFTLFGDPNEVRKAEQELDNLRMKESGQASLYIADFRSLMSRIGDWGERAYIHVYRRGLASRLLDQLASHPGNFYSLQELMDITLKLDTRYHERQKEKGSHQEKKPPISGSNSSEPPQSSSSKKPYHKKNKKGKNFQVSKDKPHAALLNKDNKLIGSEKERRIKEGLCNYCVGKHPFENASRGLRIGKVHHKASLESREKPEWGS